MFNLFEETSTTDTTELHQYVTNRYGQQSRWFREGNKLVIRLREKPSSGIVTPLPEVSIGDVVYFKVQAIPSYRIPGNKQRKSCRDNVEKIVWFKHQGDRHGFVINRVPALSTVLIKHPKHTGNLVATLFEGTLQVTDVELFNSMLLNGIGSMKMCGNIMMISKEKFNV